MSEHKIHDVGSPSDPLRTRSAAPSLRLIDPELQLSDEPNVNVPVKTRKPSTTKRSRHAKESEDPEDDEGSPSQGKPSRRAKINRNSKESMSDEMKKLRVREAARLRQRKHRAAIKARRLAEMDNQPPPPPPAQYYSHPFPHPGFGGQMNSASAAFGAPPGNLFASTLLLALSCTPDLKTSLMRTYSLSNEDLPSLEQALFTAFEHWNHLRYSAHPQFAQIAQNQAAPSSSPPPFHPALDGLGPGPSSPHHHPQHPGYRLEDPYNRDVPSNPPPALEPGPHAPFYRVDGPDMGEGEEDEEDNEAGGREGNREPGRYGRPPWSLPTSAPYNFAGPSHHAPWAWSGRSPREGASNGKGKGKALASSHYSTPLQAPPHLRRRHFGSEDDDDSMEQDGEGSGNERGEQDEGDEEDIQMELENGREGLAPLLSAVAGPPPTTHNNMGPQEFEKHWQDLLTARQQAESHVRSLGVGDPSRG